MKLNKITLLSALILAITAQPTHGMQSLKNNPYVKYGTAVLAGVGIGASLMYYVMKQPKVIPETSKELIPVILCFKQTRLLNAFCSQEELQTLKDTSTCYIEEINEKELKMYCSQSQEIITFYNDQPIKTTTNNSVITLPEKFIDRDLYLYEWRPLIRTSLKIKTSNTQTGQQKICFNE